MLRQQAYKFRIDPNGTQKRAMHQFAGNVRKVWNLALFQQQKNHEKNQKFTNSFGMNAWIPGWKKEFPYLCLSPAQTLQQVTKDLEHAFKNFFEKHADFPKIKKKGKCRESFRYPEPNQFTIDQVNNRIKLPKLGWIKYRNSREIVGSPKNITISFKAGHWYASIQTEQLIGVQPHPSTKATGLDVGVKIFVATSDGEMIHSINSFKKYLKQLSKYLRRMSHKKKFSKNWKKEKLKVQLIHIKIANVRNDFLHKVSTYLSKNHAMIVIEDLIIANMSKSASGTIVMPGKNVKQKSGLNRSILDQGWGEFRRQLEYKQTWRNGLLIAVNPRNTSRRCHCGHVAIENRKTQSKFECIKCGYISNADVNAACNILAAGLAVLACGDPERLGRSMKQEPTEVITQYIA